MTEKIFNKTNIENRRFRTKEAYYAAILTTFLVLTLSKPIMVTSGIFNHDSMSKVRQFLYLALLLFVTTEFLLKRKSRITKVVPLPIIVLIAWCSITLLWSSNFLVSTQHLFLTAVVIWLCFSCVNQLGVKYSLLTIRSVIIAGIILNFLFVYIYPSVAIHDYGVFGAREQWRGVMAHKNFAGSFSAMAVLFLVFSNYHNERWLRFIMYAAAGSAFVFLLLSQSRTSIIGLGVAVIVGAIIQKSSNQWLGATNDKNKVLIKRLFIGLCILFVFVLVFLTENKNLLLEITRNPDFLSKRSQIWQPVLEAYFSNPFFGTGYGAFWSETGKNAAPILAEEGNFFSGVTQAHNGYLDMSVQIGLIGLLICLFSIFVWPISLFRQLLRINRPICALAASILTFYLINNFTESSLFDGDQMAHVFAMLVLALLMRCFGKSRRRTYSKSHQGLGDKSIGRRVRSQDIAAGAKSSALP